MRSFSPRPALTSATACVSARTGILTPLLECTQVMPTTRVFGPMARFRFSTISSTDAAAGSSYSGTRRQLAPDFSTARRIAS